MKKTHRLVLLGTTLLGSLALAGPALAGYTPRLSVFSTGQSAGSAGVKVKYSQASNDDAVQRLSVFVPKGYTLSGGGAVGTRIGSATLSVVAGDIHKAVKTTGPLVVASASDFQTEAQACTSGATHAAVWSVTVAVSGTAFRIPIYVDTSVTGAAAPTASGELTVCFAAPDLPPGTPGRAALGAKIANFSLTTTAITTPKETGIYRWRAAAIPFTPGTNLSNAKGIVEVQSLVGLPLELTLNAKIAAANGGSSRVDLTGAFKAAGSSIPGIFVQLLYGSTPKALKAHGVLSTNRSGEFAAKGELKQGSRAQKMYFQVTTNEIEKDLGVAGCVATTPGVVPCIDATLPYNVASRVVALTIPAKG